MIGIQRVKVLFLIPTLTGGGAERVVTTLLKYLNRANFELTIATVDTRKAVFRDQVPFDVEFIDLRCSRVRYAMPRIMRLIWCRRPDVVFSTLGHLNLAMAVLRPLLPDGVTYVARETSLVSHNLTNYRWPKVWAWAYRRFYGVFDKVICQSTAMLNDLVLSFRVSPDKALVINNPIDIEHIRMLARVATVALPAEAASVLKNRVNLIAVGRLSPEKGFEILINALSLTSNRRIYLTLLGEGPLLAELLELTNAKGLNERVCFLGFQANPYPYIAQADALVLSSRHEGFPNVVLEALALQTPVIALPAAGGIHEMITGIEGCILTKDMSAETLADAFDTFEPGRRLANDAAFPYSAQDIVQKYERALFV